MTGPVEPCPACAEGWRPADQPACDGCSGKAVIAEVAAAFLDTAGDDMNDYQAEKLARMAYEIFVRSRKPQ